MTEKIVLAYSGGLDTSVACRWLQDDRGYEVHCLTVDLGQAEDPEGAQRRSLEAGAARGPGVSARRAVGRSAATRRASSVAECGA